MCLFGSVMNRLLVFSLCVLIVMFCMMLLVLINVLWVYMVIVLSDIMCRFLVWCVLLLDC